MQIARKLQNVVRALKQQWGSTSAKHRLWDDEYASGRWDHCEHSPESRVYSYIQKYSVNGSILDLGCGFGNAGNELPADSYRQYTGVDISDVALARATARSQAEGRGEKNRFFQGDIIAWQPDQKYDVILFRESIYYVPQIRIKATLDHYASHLTPTGVLIVNVGPNGTTNARYIFDLIKRNYHPIETYSAPDSDEFVAVFRANSSVQSE